MHITSTDIDASTAYKLLVSTVLPRPIALVTSINTEGQVNAAPFSFFNVMGSDPPTVVLGFEPKSDGVQKDTPNNILATREFVVNLVDEPLAMQMNQCAANLPAHVDETVHSNLETVAYLDIAAPRIQASPVSLECRLLESTTLAGSGVIVLGEILHFHLRDDVVTSTEPLRIDLDALAPIARLSGPFYARVTDRFKIQRPE